MDFVTEFVCCAVTRVPAAAVSGDICKYFIRARDPSAQNTDAQQISKMSKNKMKFASYTKYNTSKFARTRGVKQSVRAQQQNKTSAGARKR